MKKILIFSMLFLPVLSFAKTNDYLPGGGQDNKKNEIKKCADGTAPVNGKCRDCDETLKPNDLETINDVVQKWTNKPNFIHPSPTMPTQAPFVMPVPSMTPPSEQTKQPRRLIPPPRPTANVFDALDAIWNFVTHKRTQ